MVVSFVVEDVAGEGVAASSPCQGGALAFAFALALASVVSCLVGGASSPCPWPYPFQEEAVCVYVTEGVKECWWGTIIVIVK